MVSMRQVHNVTLPDVKQEKLRSTLIRFQTEISKILKKKQALDLQTENGVQITGFKK